MRCWCIATLLAVTSLAAAVGTPERHLIIVSIDGFPARMGYYLGYLGAADLGKTRSLKQLAALKPAEVKPLIDASLDRMADCRAKPA